MKSKFFVAVVVFLVVVLFAFFFGVFRTTFVSVVQHSLVAVHSGIHAQMQRIV